MAIASILPVVWGVYTGNMPAATWITLTAECICWVELKGSFAQRMRVLLGGTLLAIFFGITGSITGISIWLSVFAMLLVGFLASLFKNLGDRGSGLAICVYVLFIISNAYPAQDMDALKQRSILILTGGVWTFIASTAVVLFLPAQEPYRRSIALIWRANTSLLETVMQGWNGKGLRSSLRNIYLKEKEVRTAIDNSLHLFEQMAHQADIKEKEEYQLAQLRKATSLAGTHIVAISEELETIKFSDISKEVLLKTGSMLSALRQAFERMSVYVITLKPEDALLLSSRISNVNKRISVLRNTQMDDSRIAVIINRIIQLTERTIRLMETALGHLEQMGGDRPLYNSYSMMKTLFVLHPKHWVKNTRLLFNLNSFTTRYALRSAVAASVAMLLYKWFHIDHGYWLAFTAMIVVQPYFGATFTKAVDRILGTITGGITGGLLVALPAGMYLKEIILFICFICMVYFLRKKYSYAAFFITVSLVLLFDVEESIDASLIMIRALCTIGGAALAIIAGFALLPDWDRKWLPIHLSNAILCNYEYFRDSFYGDSRISNWTKYKRNAELKNSNAFDSFSRYMQEPGIGDRPYIAFYQVIMHNVRITRELNNIHLETEHQDTETETATEDQQIRIDECCNLFEEIVQQLRILNPAIKPVVSKAPSAQTPFTLSVHQMFYLDKMLSELKALHKDLAEIRQTGIIPLTR